jgi:ankyrin repeat protein
MPGNPCEKYCGRVYWCCVYCCRCFRPLKKDLVKLLMEATQRNDETMLEYTFVRCQMETERSKGTLQSHDVLNSLGDDGLGALHYCAKNDALTMLLRLMNTPRIDLNIVDSRGFTPLHIACKRGHNACTGMILNFGASVNVLDRKKNTPLVLAASGGHRASVKALVDHGANQDVKNILGLTALMASIIHQQESTAIFLIKVGSDVTVADSHGNTALHYAAEANMLKVAKFLMENGARCRTYNKFNETPLLESKRQMNPLMQTLLSEFDEKQQRKIKEAKLEKNHIVKLEVA